MKVLTLSADGTPRRWIDIETAIVYHAKDLVAWSLGDTAQTLHGGYNDMGARSTLTTASIIAIKGTVFSNSRRHKYNSVPLKNSTLFARDKHFCAYCGRFFKSEDKLSRDHIIPVSKGGQDTWMNVVTACCSCNRLKADRTPEQADMELLYLPYVPNRYEHLILMNRSIRADQFEFLKAGVAANSRVHKWVI